MAEQQPFPADGLWLSGTGLASLVAGFSGTWFLLTRLHQVIAYRHAVLYVSIPWRVDSKGGREVAWLALCCCSVVVMSAGTPMVHPLIKRSLDWCSWLTLSTLLVVWLTLRAYGEPARDRPSLPEEVQFYLRGVGSSGASPLNMRLLLEDMLAVYTAFSLLRSARSVLRVVAIPWAEKKAFITDRSFDVVRHLPAVASRLRKEVEKTEAHLEATLRPGGNERTPCRLPVKGRRSEDILVEMKRLAGDERAKWSRGMASGAVYNDSDEHASMVSKAYALFSHSNPLHPDLWPSGLKFEGEVISMTARLLDGGDAGVCGVLTSGGTESIILAAKAHRDFYRQRGVRAPEVVAATSAHAAIDKACIMMGIRLIKVPVDPKTMKADVRAMVRAVSSNTILIYASAPSFPHGTIDPIEALGKVAIAHGCGLHVDCCLGGFVLPFAKKLGYPLPNFDFGVKGVTSISADTHKYGYAPKGTSVALFRHKELRHEAYFCFPDWTGGLYVTPTIAGSRPGGLTAACWASMVSMGEEGYETAVAGILNTAKEVAEGISNIAGLSLVGDPQAMVVCFGTEAGVNIYKVGDQMNHRGWSLNALQRPPCLHLCVTLCHVGRAKVFLEDLQASTREAAASGSEGDENSTAAIYGMASSMPGGPVKVLLRAYTDVILGK